MSCLLAETWMPMDDRLSPRAVAAAVVALTLLAGVVMVLRRSGPTGGARLTGYATVD